MNSGGADEIFVSSGVRLFEAKGVQIDGNFNYIITIVINH